MGSQLRLADTNIQNMFRNKRNGRSLSQDLNQIARELDQLLKKELPREAEAKLQEIVFSSFEKEQYQDGKSKKWKSRKQSVKEAKQGSRKLLIKTGEGRRSVDTFRRGNTVGVGTDSPYMPVHNEGKQAGKGKGFKMPERQHMPKPGEENKVIMNHLDKFLDKKSDKIFRK